MKTSRLKHLYIGELKDLYSAETQLVKALPKMAKAATSKDLRAGFEGHLEQTKEHVTRLKFFFKALGESPIGKECKDMEGLITEGSEMITGTPAAEERDTGLISAAERVEHYEIAVYGCVSAYAKLLGEDQADSLLRHTLEEEKQTNQKLTHLVAQINIAASQSGESDENTGQLKKTATPKTKAARA